MQAGAGVGAVGAAVDGADVSVIVGATVGAKVGAAVNGAAVTGLSEVGVAVGGSVGKLKSVRRVQAVSATLQDRVSNLLVPREALLTQL